jgi:hypothetical protein
MKECLKENKLPVNQFAKSVLKKPGTSMLYCLHAADEAVSKGLLKVSNPALLDSLNALLAEWSPENANKFLEGECDIVKHFPKNMDLQSVGNTVLQQLDSRMSAELIGYCW